MGPTAPAPRTRLGQHFLVDANIVRKIVAAAAITSDETVLEIGPGRGILTEALCHAAKHVIAVELDRRLAEYVRETLRARTNLDVREGDALTFPYDSLPPGTVVVANLPYYISTPLLFTLFDARHRLDRMVLMLQTEVARRLVAPPGSKEYGILSVLCRYWTEPKVAFHVSRHCFHPKPDVESTVLTLAVRREPPVLVRDEAHFVRIVRAAFAHRRKTVANSLRNEGFPPEAVAAALAHAHIAPTRRAETLSLEEFAALSEALIEL